jgi:carbon monoxide dehydrogenase subunit G
MSTVEVSVEIRAPLEAVWAAAADLGSHAEWMADAESITFLTARQRGLGTRMEVATRIGPLRTKDIMEVTEWEDRRRIGVRHTGLVTGRGAFELEEVDPATTRFTWRERLTFPWYLGGPLIARVASPVLGAVWKRNLKRLKSRLEH